MTAATFSKALPLRNWRYFGDRNLLLAFLPSFLFHLALLVVVSHMATGDVVGRYLDTDSATPWVFLPPITDFKPPVDASAPKVNPVAGNSKASGAPAATARASAKSGGLLGVLQDNQQLLSVLTHEGGLNAKLPGMNTGAGPFATPQNGVRLASAGDHSPVMTDAPHSERIDMPNTIGPKASAPIGERARREVTSTMHAPQTDSTDADANRLVREALLARMPAVKHCYEKALNANSKLEGKITAQATFDASGAVQSAALSYDGLGDAGAAACIADALRKARTAAPLGRSITATVPYVFAAMN
jgi:hypothetical protein